MVESYREILWADISVAVPGRHPTANYWSGINDPVKQAAIYRNHFRNKIIGLYTKKYLTTNDKRKLRDFRSAYTFNA